MFILALFTLFAALAVAADCYVGARKIPFLRNIYPPPEEIALPRLSIIIPARNEAGKIERALGSVLRQDYPDREILVLDDRSTDATGQILDATASRYPYLNVAHISGLPAGWLGKNHALQVGAEKATGELLLFTDADVMMEQSTLKRAVNYLEMEGLDHITVAPTIVVPGFLANLAVGAFTMLFGGFMRPWKADDPKSKRFIGIGAFNLIRKSVYDAVGGHEAIRMRPDDDLKLGKLVKDKGFRQRMLWGKGLVSVEWYSSFPEMVRGLEKNMFAGSDYRLWFAALLCVASFLLNVWPGLAIFFTSGWTWSAYFLVLVTYFLMYWDNARFNGGNPYYGVIFPLGAAIHLYLFVNSTVKTIVNGGIEWRGTRYSLRELKANRV